MNKSLLIDSTNCDIRISSITNYDGNVDFQNFSAKYVINGKELYTLNNKKYLLQSGEYVVGNSFTNSSVLIDSQEEVKGICIDISKELLSYIISFQYINPENLSKFLFEQEWMVNKYNSKNTSLGYTFQRIAKEFDNLKNGNTLLNNELFFSIAECVVADQSKVFDGFKKLDAIKEETNGRLFNYIYDAKNYIENHFLEKISIDDISKEAKISEYHFIRLFKTVFNTTPYKYIIEKRLDFASELLKENYSISDVSTILGYTDVPAFSKAFKKQYGSSPKLYKSN